MSHVEQLVASDMHFQSCILGSVYIMFMNYHTLAHFNVKVDIKVLNYILHLIIHYHLKFLHILQLVWHGHLGIWLLELLRMLRNWFCSITQYVLHTLQRVTIVPFILLIYDPYLSVLVHNCIYLTCLSVHQLVASWAHTFFHNKLLPQWLVKYKLILLPALVSWLMVINRVILYVG